MGIDWDKFGDFLRNLKVDLGNNDAPDIVPEEPMITVLQRSYDHEAFYRIDWLESGPELLVLLPTNQAPLKFHFYRVQFSETYPLNDALTKLLHYQGSVGFEQKREAAEWQLLSSMVETMKSLFWAGRETSQFPSEIIVQKIC